MNAKMQAKKGGWWLIPTFLGGSKTANGDPSKVHIGHMNAMISH